MTGHGDYVDQVIKIGIKKRIVLETSCKLSMSIVALILRDCWSG